MIQIVLLIFFISSILFALMAASVSIANILFSIALLYACFDKAQEVFYGKEKDGEIAPHLIRASIQTPSAVRPEICLLSFLHG